VPVSRVVRARKASRAFQKGSGPWVTDEDAMWRKTAVRAARPFLLLSAEAGYAVASDGSTVVGITVENETAEAILVAEEAEE
jgi:recombinational DNA repair protein RecT